MAANIYLNEVDWAFDAIRRKTAQGPYEAVNYHRFSDDIVITVSGHHSKRGWAERALERLQEEIGASWGQPQSRQNPDCQYAQRRIVWLSWGSTFAVCPKRRASGYFILMTPKKKARKAIKAKIRDIIRNSGATPAKEVMSKINTVLTGWVNYFRVGNSNRAFSEVRDYVEMKVRTLLTRRKRRQKRSIGWRRWSNEYLYGVLGLYWDWKIHPLKGAECYK